MLGGGPKRNSRYVLARPGLVLFFVFLLLAAWYKQFPATFQEVRSLFSLPGFERLAGGILGAAEKEGFPSRLLLVEGMPVLGSVNREVAASGRTRLLTLSFYTLTRVDITDPRTFFRLQLPVVAMESRPDYNPADPEQEGPILEPIEEDAPEPAPGPPGPALAGIYTSHNSESYTGDGGELYESGNGEIAQVASSLSDALETAGIPTVRSDKIHDVPVREQAYSRSIITANQMVKDNPRLQVLLDVHRDGLPEGKNKRVLMLEGKPAAKVMIVLGTRYANWQQNEKFAKDLVARGNELYPGLFLPIYYATDARYNQHLLPHALLLEFGDQYNTTQEADRAAQAVAKVLAGLIKEDMKGG